MKLEENIYKQIIQACEEAGEIILNSPKTIRKKPDGTDLTPADEASDNYLTAKTREIFGNDVQVLSEESTKDKKDALDFTDPEHLTVVIDPLDGTSNFTKDPKHKDSKHYAVLYGVLEGRKPIFGVIVLPAFGITIYGGEGIPATWLRKNVRNGTVRESKVTLSTKAVNSDPKILTPRRFMGKKEDFKLFYDELETFRQISDIQPVRGSRHILSRLIPVLDHGAIRFYAASKRNQWPGDWDICAFDAVVRSLGGITTDIMGNPIEYGNTKEEYKHSGIITWPTVEAAKKYQAARKKHLEDSRTRLSR